MWFLSSFNFQSLMMLVRLANDPVEDNDEISTCEKLDIESRIALDDLGDALRSTTENAMLLRYLQEHAQARSNGEGVVHFSMLTDASRHRHDLILQTLNIEQPESNMPTIR